MRGKLKNAKTTLAKNKLLYAEAGVGGYLPALPMTEPFLSTRQL